MNTLLQESLYFGFVFSLAVYFLMDHIRKKYIRTDFFNPLLMTNVVVILTLLVLHIDYDTYNAGAKYITYFLTPATVCLAVPMYKKVQLLKTYLWAILGAVTAGCLASALTVFLLCRLFQVDTVLYRSLQAKSITTAIALGVTEEIGGNMTFTAIATMITGIGGAMLAKIICRLFRITHPVAVGLACGTSAHAVGTSKALEFGEVEGAMSSLALVVAGIMTVVIAPLVAQFT